MNDSQLDRLSCAILELACTVDKSTKEFIQESRIDRDERKSLSRIEKHLQDLQKLGEHIMSAISEFATKQKDFNTRQSAAIDSLATSQTGIVEDIQTLNDKITELQNSAGGVTPEDQALIDELQAQGEALSAKVEAVAEALKALDALTSPKPPTQ